MLKASRTNNYLYNPLLKERARELRRKGTKAEAYLWKFVLSKKSMGYRFLRQRPVLNYIADFMCLELLLIVECDGATHLMEGADKKDAKRQEKLEHVGFKVIRLEDDAVLNNIGIVCTIVGQEIEKREKELGLS
jgi:very-short-patch-repair endonuclease